MEILLAEDNLEDARVTIEASAGERALPREPGAGWS